MADVEAQEPVLESVPAEDNGMEAEAQPVVEEQPVEEAEPAGQDEQDGAGDADPAADVENSNKRKLDEEDDGDDEAGPAKKKALLDDPPAEAAAENENQAPAQEDAEEEPTAKEGDPPDGPSGQLAPPAEEDAEFKPAAKEGDPPDGPSGQSAGVDVLVKEGDVPDNPPGQPAPPAEAEDEQQADPPQNGSGAAPAEHMEEKMECPRNLVGKLIGREGLTIRELQNRSGARIQVDHAGDGPNKTVTISGTPEAVREAKSLIQQTLEDTPSAADIEKVVECPAGIVGRIIGRGGETIKALQTASNAHILVNQDFPEGQPRKIHVTGKPEFVDRAVKMIQEVIQGDPASVQAIIAKYGETRLMSCPKNVVGRIIGKGGETIKALQKESQSSIQIDQSTDPSKITIVGKRVGVDHAVARIQALIDDVPFHGSASYAPPGGYAPGLRPPYAGGAAPPFAQPYAAPAAYGGYGGYPAAGAAGYGGYGAYGAYPAAYGGGHYGAYGSSYGATAPAAADPYAGGYQAGSAGYQAGAAGYGGAAAAGGYGGAAAAAGGAVWREERDNEGRAYYYNTKTGVSQWEKPAEMA